MVDQVATAPCTDPVQVCETKFGLDICMQS